MTLQPVSSIFPRSSLPDERKTWPYHCTLRFFTVISRSSCGPIACWTLARTLNSLTHEPHTQKTTTNTEHKHLCNMHKTKTNLWHTKHKQLWHIQGTSNFLCQLAYLEIKRIGSIRQYLSVEATRTLVSSLVLSRLDYRKALLTGCPQVLLDKIQRVIKCSARLIYKASKFAYITPLLFDLHWLPISRRIQYKIALTCFNIVSGTTPPNLSPPKGGRGFLMSPACLESEGRHLIPLYYLLSCSSAWS